MASLVHQVAERCDSISLLLSWTFCIYICPQNVESASLTRFNTLGLTKKGIVPLGYCIMSQVEC